MDTLLTEFIELSLIHLQDDGSYMVEFDIPKRDLICYVLGCSGFNSIQTKIEAYYIVRNIIENNGDSSRAIIRKKESDPL